MPLVLGARLAAARYIRDPDREDPLNGLRARIGGG